MTPEARLSLGLTWWRRTFSPEVSTLLVQLEDAAPPLVEAEARAQGDRAGQLTALVLASTDLTRGPMLTAFAQLARNALPSKLWPALEQWVRARLEPDPRIGALALELLTRAGAVREVTHKLSEVLLDLLAQHGDAGHAATLRAFAPYAHAQWQRQLARTVQRLELRGDDAVPSEVLRALRAGVAPPTPTGAAGEEALRAAIFAAPEDDAPRLAWADWLTERGDERGEFIVLQINRARGAKPTPEARERERVLLTRNRTALLGPLLDLVQLSDLVFSRGFPSRGRLSYAARPLPELRLFERLNFDRVATFPVMEYPALRDAVGVPLAALPLLGAKAPRLESLELVATDATPPFTPEQLLALPDSLHEVSLWWRNRPAMLRWERRAGVFAALHLEAAPAAPTPELEALLRAALTVTPHTRFDEVTVHRAPVLAVDELKRRLGPLAARAGVLLSVDS